MYEQNTVGRDLSEVVSGGNFADIPMRDDLRFKGPLATSETLTFADGVLVAADLIIDSTPLRPPAEA